MTVIREEQVAYHGAFVLYNAESSHRGGFKVEFQLGSEDDYKTFRMMTKRKKNRAGITFIVSLLGQYPRQLHGYFTGWRVSNNEGALVKMELADEEDYNFFRLLPAMVSSENPIKWEVVIAEVDDEGKKVDQKQREEHETRRGGPLSQHAGRLCNDRDFQQWVGQKEGLKRIAKPEECAEFIREKCDIKSRADLDHDERAAERYHKWVTKPYAIATGPGR